MNDPILVRFRHYKGNEYTVLGLARHSETLEELVVYRQEYGEHGLWVRPKQMFLETVDVNGRDVPRFQRVDASASNNVFQNLPKSLPQELVLTLLHAENLRIERIVSDGHASPDGFWYDQDQAEWVIVLTDAARLRFDDALLEMKSGDFVNIPSHKKHRVEWTSPAELDCLADGALRRAAVNHFCLVRSMTVNTRNLPGCGRRAQPAMIIFSHLRQNESSPRAIAFATPLIHRLSRHSPCRDYKRYWSASAWPSATTADLRSASKRSAIH